MYERDGNLHYPLEEFKQDTGELIVRLKPQVKIFNGVWGPAKGGIVLAVWLAYGLDLPLILNEDEVVEYNTLVVDDIVDTGKRLGRFAGKNFITSLFYHRHSSFEPNIWLHEKPDWCKWVIYPWAPNDIPEESAA